MCNLVLSGKSTIEMLSSKVSGGTFMLRRLRPIIIVNIAVLIAVYVMRMFIDLYHIESYHGVVTFDMSKDDSFCSTEL